MGLSGLGVQGLRGSGFQYFRGFREKVLGLGFLGLGVFRGCRVLGISGVSGPLGSGFTVVSGFSI